MKKSPHNLSESLESEYFREKERLMETLFSFEETETLWKFLTCTKWLGLMVTEVELNLRYWGPEHHSIAFHSRG